MAAANLLVILGPTASGKSQLAFELARRAGQAQMNEIVIQPPLITFEGDRGDGRGYVLEPDVDAIRARVQELIGN